MSIMFLDFDGRIVLIFGGLVGGRHAGGSRPIHFSAAASSLSVFSPKFFMPIRTS